MESQTKSNLADKGTWMRLIYMILFAVIFNVAELVTGVVVVLQFLFKLLTGKANEQLRNFGHNLAAYFQQIVGFLTYQTEEMPYPFGEWPGTARANPAPAAAQPTAAADQPSAAAAKATPAKRSPAKKRPKPASKAAPKAKGGKPAVEEVTD